MGNTSVNNSFRQYLIREGLFKKDPARGMTPSEYADHMATLANPDAVLMHQHAAAAIKKANIKYDIEKSRNPIHKRLGSAIGKLARGIFKRPEKVEKSEMHKAVADARADERGKVHDELNAAAFQEKKAIVDKQTARNARRGPIIAKMADKAKARREAKIKDIPSDFSTRSKVSAKADAMGIRGAVRRYSDTKLAAIGKKRPENSMVGLSVRNELASRRTKHKKTAEKLTQIAKELK